MHSLSWNQASWCIDGIKPKMISTATATSSRRKMEYEGELYSNESDNFEEE